MDSAVCTYIVSFYLCRKAVNVFQKVGYATLTQIVVLETLQTRVLTVSIQHVSHLSTLVTGWKIVVAIKFL